MLAGLELKTVEEEEGTVVVTGKIDRGTSEGRLDDELSEMIGEEE